MFVEEGSDLPKIGLLGQTRRTLLQHFQQAPGRGFQHVPVGDTHLSAMAKELAVEKENTQKGISFALNKHILAYSARGAVGSLTLHQFVACETLKREQELANIETEITTKFITRAEVMEGELSLAEFSVAMSNMIVWMQLYYGDHVAGVLGKLKLALIASLDVVGYFQFTREEAVRVWNGSMKALERGVDHALARLKELVGMSTLGFDGSSASGVRNAFMRVATTMDREGGPLFTHPLEYVDPDSAESWFRKQKELATQHARTMLVRISAVTWAKRPVIAGTRPTQPSKRAAGEGVEDQRATKQALFAHLLLTPAERAEVKASGLGGKARVCFKNLCHSGCQNEKCWFEHKEVPLQDLTPIQELGLAAYGGHKDGPHYATEQAVRKAIGVLRKKIGPSTKAGGWQPSAQLPTALQSLVQSSHASEQELVQVLAAEGVKNIVHPIMPAGLPPVRQMDVEVPLSEPEMLTLRLKQQLCTRFPDLRGGSDDLMSGFYAASLTALRRNPRASEQELYDVGVRSLLLSVKPGAVELGWKLQIPSRLAGTVWGPQDVRGTTTAVQQDGAHVFQVGPCQRPQPWGDGQGSFILATESFGVRDLGEAITYPTGQTLSKQCVLLCLAAVVGAEPWVLSQALREEASVVQGDVPGGPLNPAQMEVLQIAHDFEHLEQGNLDIHLVRYLGASFFRPIRLIVLLANDTGMTVEVQVIQSPEWGHSRGDHTHMFLMTQNHARVVTRMPTQWGGSLINHKRDAATVVRPIPNNSADAFLSACATWGLLPSYFHHLEKAQYALTSTGEDSVMREDLLPCPTCAALVRAPVRRARGMCPAERMVAGALSRDELPPSLALWMKMFSTVGGMSAANLAKIYADRSAVEQRFACMPDQQLRDHQFSPLATQLVSQLRTAAYEDWSAIDRAEVQANEASVLVRLGALAHKVRAIGDALVQEVGSVVEAMAVVRQSSLRSEERLPMDVERLQAVKDLLSPDTFETLEGMARFGVPLGVLSSPDGVTTPKTPSYSSALLATGDILYNTVKDVVKGKALMLSEKGLAGAEQLRYHPTGAVKKSDGKEYRPVSDLRELNSIIEEQRGVRKERVCFDEPPAVCPFIEDVARMVIYQSQLNPLTPVLLHMRDVDNAYKRVFTNVADSPALATELPSFPGLEGSTTAVYQVLLFGWAHSPGWFGVLAWSITAAWKRLSPIRPEINGIRPFSGSIHVDDLVSVQSAVGNAPALASAAFDDLAEKMAGVGAINKKKDLKEGPPGEVKTLWGYNVDLRGLEEQGLKACTISIPEVKIAKLGRLVSEEFIQQVHNRKVTRTQQQVLQGMTIYCQRAAKWLTITLAPQFQMCASESEEWLQPVADDATVDRWWQEYEEAVRLLRLLCKDSAHFEASFTSSVVGALKPAERIQLNVPGMYLQSDATGGSGAVMAVVDFQASEWAAHPVGEVMETLRSSYLPMDGEARVAWAELVPVVAVAIRNGQKWRGLLVISLVDNMEACATINKRAVRDPVMRYLQCLLVRLEQQFGFEMWSPYINTHHNVLADDISRKYTVLDEGQLQAHVDTLHKGLRRVDMTVSIQALVRECVTAKKAGGVVSFAFPEEQETKETRTFRASTLVQVRGQEEQRCPAIVEMNAALGQYAVAGWMAGCRPVKIVESHTNVQRIACDRLTQQSNQPSMQACRGGILVVGTFYQKDKTFSEVLHEVTAAMDQMRPRVVVWTFRVAWGAKTQELEQVSEAMRGWGLVKATTWTEGTGGSEAEEVVDAGDLFSPILGRRLIVQFELEAMVERLGELSPCDAGEPRDVAIRSHLEPWEEVPEEAWVDGEVQRSSRRSVGRGKCRIELNINTTWKGKKTTFPVQSIRAPAAAAVSWSDLPTGGGGMLIWDERCTVPRARSLTEVELARLQGIPVEAVRSMKRQGLHAAYWIGDAAPAYLAKAVVVRAMGRWQCFERLAKQGVSRKASGGPSLFLGRGMGVEPGTKYETAVAAMMSSSIQQTSQRTYSYAFKHWIEWRRLRMMPLWAGEAGEDVEMELLQFVAHRGMIMGYAHGTVHVMLQAVRYEHLLARKESPIVDRPLLQMAMKGLKRLQGGVVRKIPATVDLIRRAVSKLDLTAWDDLVTASAMVFMFLFMTRSREVVRKGSVTDQRQCLRNHMLTFFANGVLVEGEDIMKADEVVWMAGYSKVDKNGQGTVRNVFEVPQNDLCLLKLLKQMHTRRPGCFSRGEDFVFRCEDGEVVERSRIVSSLRAVAEEMGIPEKALSVISLRSGGASAMWDAKYSVDDIKMRGRWASDSFKRYVWEGRDKARDLAQNMLESKFSLMASLAYYRRHASEGGGAVQGEIVD